MKNNADIQPAQSVINRGFELAILTEPLGFTPRDASVEGRIILINGASGQQSQMALGVKALHALLIHRRLKVFELDENAVPVSCYEVELKGGAYG